MKSKTTTKVKVKTNFKIKPFFTFDLSRFKALKFPLGQYTPLENKRLSQG